MRELSADEFETLLKQRNKEQLLDLREIKICDMDLSGRDLSGVNFTKSALHNVILCGANMQGSVFQDALFKDCILRNADFSNASLVGTELRYADMTGCNLVGANLYCAVLEFALLDRIRSDDTTKWFRMYCPETGPLLGYKKCVNDRLVQLLIPADAKRTSATRPSCRCSKAKVLTIKSFDYSEHFTEAWSLVDENFVYRVGAWVEVKDFNEDRWMDSTTGIHFWMTRQEAKAY